MPRCWRRSGSGSALFAAIPIAFVVAAALGLLIERCVVRRLYGRLGDTLLATWGVAILVQQAVRLEGGLAFFGIHIEGLGPGLQNMPIPTVLQGAVMVGDTPINAYRAFIVACTVVLTFATWLLLYRTRIGMQVRAIIRNPRMAAACGIDVQRVNAWTFAFGAGLAGITGVLVAGFKTVSPDMGTALVVDSFLVVVLGRRRQPARRGRHLDRPRRGHGRGGGGQQRHPRARGGVRPGDPADRRAAAGPVSRSRGGERHGHSSGPARDLRRLRDLPGPGRAGTAGARSASGSTGSPSTLVFGMLGIAVSP